MQKHWLSQKEVSRLGESLFGSLKFPSHVVKYGDHWYFWDEAQTDCCGPFDTVEEAESGLEIYAKTI
jgi:hypothetical protein